MADVNLEMGSFMTKFKSLLNAGCKATLNFKADNGHLCVSLSADINVLPSSRPRQGPSVVHPRKRGPAYFRRQQRRHNAAIEKSRLIASMDEKDEEVTPSLSSTTVQEPKLR